MTFAAIQGVCPVCHQDNSLSSLYRPPTKVYVLESGCKYEGGGVFFATTDFKKAWKVMREARIKEDQEDNGVMRTISQFYWANDYMYFTIRVFEE